MRLWGLHAERSFYLFGFRVAAETVNAFNPFAFRVRFSEGISRGVFFRLDIGKSAVTFEISKIVPTRVQEVMREMFPEYKPEPAFSDSDFAVLNGGGKDGDR